MKGDTEIEELRRLFRENPQDLSSGLALVQCCADHGWYNESLDICRKLLQSHPSEYALLLEYANVLYRHKDYAEAKTIFSKLTLLKPERIEGWNNLGILELAAGNIEAAAEAFTKVLEVEPQNPGALLNLGNYYSEKGDAAKAVTYFEQATAVKADFPEAWFNLGNSYLVLRDYQRAKIAYERAIYFDMRFGSAYKNLGFTCEKLEDFENARKQYIKAFELNKADAGILMNLVGIYIKQNNLEGAFDCCKKAVRLSPREPSGWLALRRIALELRDHLSYFKATLAVVSRIGDSDLALSIDDLRDMDSEDEAQKLLEHADRLSRGGDMLDALRMVMYKKRKLQPGRTTLLFRRLSLLPDPEPLVVRCMAEYAYMVGSYERVIRLLEPLDDLTIRHKILLWRSYVRVGKAELAEKLALEYDQQHPGSFDCLVLLAELRAAAKDEEKAREYLVKACSSGKGDFLSLQVNPALLKIFRSIQVNEAASVA